MKEILISFFLMACIATVSTGQSRSYGLNIVVGGGAILGESSMGGASYDMNTGFAIGLNYNKRLTNRLTLMTGLNWYNNSIIVTPAYYPGIGRTSKKYNLQLIYIPLLLKVNFGKYFFLNGGIIGDIDISGKKVITNQSGIGASLGMGTEFLVSDKFLIQLNPYLNFHGLLLVDSDKYPSRIFDPGIKLSFLINK